MKNNQSEATQKDLKSRTRSPAYPCISLKEAIDKAKLIYDHEGRNPAKREVIGTHWGHKSNSGSLNSAIAALKKYGILDTDEINQQELKLTELALDILLCGDNDIRRQTAIKKCALNPTINQEIWGKYTDLPSDSNLKSYLLRDKQFNPKASNKFIENFKETIEFANLRKGDKIGETDELAQEDKKDFNMVNNTLSPQIHPQQSINKQTLETKEAYFPLKNGSAYIRIPANMSETDKKMLFCYLDVWKENIVTNDDKKNIEVNNL
jgi:hypothetical protein